MLNSNTELKLTSEVIISVLHKGFFFFLLNEKLTLTLCSDRVRDWTGVTEAISIHCSDHKEVDSSRLQVP